MYVYESKLNVTTHLALIKALQSAATGINPTLHATLPTLNSASAPQPHNSTQRVHIVRVCAPSVRVYHLYVIYYFVCECFLSSKSHM